MIIEREINRILSATLGIKIKRTSERKIHPLQTIKSLRTRSILGFNIVRFMEDMQVAFNKTVPNQSFIKTRGVPRPLHVSVNKGNIEKITLQIDAFDFLHLHSIAFLDEDGNRIQQVDISDVTISSEFGQKFDKKAIKNLFTLNGSHACAFQTQPEHYPTLKITFSKPLYIGSIIIKNRKGRTSLRVYGLSIHAFIKGTGWKKVYQFGDINKFDTLTNEIYSRYNLARYRYGDIVFNITKLVLQGGRHRSAKELYLKLPADVQLLLRSALNTVILSKQNLEWNSHGIRRTFRFWTSDHKKKYVEFSSHVVKDLQELSPHACLGFGSVLAAVRDKDLIPHDDDMDTIIGFEKQQAATLTEALDLVEKHMTKKGYKVHSRAFNLWHVKNDTFSIDVFVGIFDSDNTIGWYPGPRGVIKKSDVFPAKKTSLLGVECFIPNKQNVYLEKTYGKSWKKPDPSHLHDHKKGVDVKALYSDIQ